MALKVGDSAPDFELPSTSGTTFKLSEVLKKGKCVIYFYPMDFTKGCTKQACNIRNEFDLFRDQGINVVGINKGSIAKHKKFIEDNNLPFELLHDDKGKVAKAYGAIIPIIGLVKRVTYIIDQNGKIEAAIEGLFQIEKHIEELKKQLK